MKREAAVAFVVKSLVQHHDRDEIIRSLCEQSGASWSDVETFVQEVEAEHGQKIAVRQSPFLIALGIVISLGGLGLILSAGQYFLTLVQQDTLHLVLSAQGVYYQLGSLFTGLCMLTGGLIGLRQPILALLEAMKLF